jgi:hypothetical protein
MLEEKNNDSNQYEGFLETEPIFTLQTNPFTQSLLQLKKTNSSGIDNLQLKKKLMLGKRAEAFFKHQIENTGEYEILVENIQIQQNKITLGELDFILEEKKSLKKIHVEVSYKFYLYDPTIKGTEIKKWIGPNRNDDLVKKVTKLQAHQFPLIYSKQAKETLEEFDLEKIQQQVFFKAQLFIPIHLKNHSFTSINLKAIKGYYISYIDFTKENHTKNLFHMPIKQDWLALPSSNSEWNSFDEISQELFESIEKQKAPLLWIQKDTSVCESLFVTWW